MSERLTGTELLAHHEQGMKAGSPKRILASLAGYMKTLPDGKVRVLFGEYTRALLAAKGISVGVKAKSASRPGRELGWEASVLPKGGALIGAGYLRQIGAAPGGRLAISLKGKEIRLRVA